MWYTRRMALIDLEWLPPPGPQPTEVEAYLAAAGARINGLSEGWFDSPVHGFVPSDFPLVRQGLAAVVEQGLAPGGALCEWGSGMGVVTGLACMLGFDAWGIEIEANLAEAARDLADEFGLSAQFVCGNFLPPDCNPMTDELPESCWLATSGADAYEEIGLDVDDFDVIFTYSWPDDEAVVAEVFHRYAATGALLLTYHGLEGLRLRRKVRNK